MSLGKQALGWLTLGGAVFLGWAMMTYFTPTKEDMLKKYPADRETLKQTEKYNQDILKALEDASKNKDPFWKKK